MQNARVTLSSEKRREDLVSPAASRQRVSAWRDPRLVVGLALVAVCALLGATLLGGGSDTVGVWATRAPLTEGQTLTQADLVRREVHFAEQADANRYLPADQASPTDRVLSHDVGAGELLARTALVAGRPEAALEVPLSVPLDAVPATVAVGSVVDVWVTPDPALGGGTPEDVEAALVLDDVRVVELARVGGGLGGSTRPVVVALDQGQQDTLPTALARSSQGALVLVRTP